MTTRPVYTVLHGPIEMLGVDRRLFGYAFFGGLMVAALGIVYGRPLLGMMLGLATFIVGYAFAYWTRDDHTLVKALLRATRTRTHYDHVAYRPVEIEVR